MKKPKKKRKKPNLDEIISFALYADNSKLYSVIYRDFDALVETSLENFLEKTEESLEYILIMNDALAPELMKKVEAEIKKIRTIKETFYWPITPMAAHTLGKGSVVAVIGPSWEVEL